MKYVFKDDSPWVPYNLTHHLQFGYQASQFAEGETLLALLNYTILAGEVSREAVNEAFRKFQAAREALWFENVEPLPTDSPVPIYTLRRINPAKPTLLERIRTYALHDGRNNPEWHPINYIEPVNRDADKIAHTYIRNVSQLYMNWRGMHDQDSNDPNFILIGRKLKYILKTISHYPMETE